MGDLWSFSSKIPGRLSPGELVAERFEVIEEVGQGQSGLVYKARDQRQGGFVALKVLRASSEEVKKRFQREGEISAGLDHPHIAKLLHSGEHKEQLYFAFEFIDGRSLDEVPRDQLQVEDQFQILTELASALAHAHSKSIVHRDLKSNNIILDNAGHAHIVDFGLARAPDLESLTETGAIVGTPRFMAPEQLKSGGQRASPQADIWSFGILIYHLLTGEYPFTGANITELTRATLATPIPRLPPQRDPMAGIQAVFEVCLKRDAAQRFKDGQELSRALAKSAQYQRRRRLKKLAKGFFAALTLSPLLFLTYTLLFDKPEQRFQKSLKSFQSGQLSRAALQKNFEAMKGSLSPKLRGRALTALAQSHLDQEEWIEARACLEQLTNENQALTGGAEFLWGCLKSHDKDFAEAARHFERAYKKGHGNEALKEEVLAWILAGDLDRAQLRASFALTESSLEPLPFTLFLSHARRQSAAKKPFERFLEGLCARLPIPELLLLRAHFILEAGGDPLESLELLVQRHPRNLPGRLEFAKQLLFQGQGRQAWRVLRKGKRLFPALQNPELLHYEAQLSSLIQRSPLKALDHQSSSWNNAIQSFLFRRLQREFGAHERQSDPRINYQSTVSLGDREQRILWDINAALKHGASPELCLRLRSSFETTLRQSTKLKAAPKIFETRLGMLQAQALIGEQKAKQTLDVLQSLKGNSVFQQRSLELLRVRALLSSGQKQGALRKLEELHRGDFLDARVCRHLMVLYRDEGRPQESKLHSDHRKDLLGRYRDQAHQHFMTYQRLKRRSDSPKELIVCLDRALKAEPLHWPSHIKKALFILADLKPIQGLDQALHVLDFAPQYHSELIGFFQVAWAPEAFLKHRERYRFEVLLKQLPDTARGRLMRAVLQSYAVEKLQRGDLIKPTLALLNEALERNPSATTPRLCRAFLYIRLRQWARAEDDLRRYEDDQKKSSLSYFYRALILASKARPAAELAQTLAKVAQFDFAIWKRPGWSIECYPELKAYLDSEDVRAVIGTK